MTYEKTSLVAKSPSTSIIVVVYVYYVQLYVTIYVAYAKYPHEPLDFSELYHHIYAYNVYSCINIICVNSQILYCLLIHFEIL